MPEELFVNPEKLHDDIYRLREVLNVSQAGLGQRVGVSNLSVHRWEAGKTKPHSLFIKRMKALWRKNKPKGEE